MDLNLEDSCPLPAKQSPDLERGSGSRTNIVNAWGKDAKKGERVKEWIDRIGWEGFFKKTGLPFTYKHVDGYIYGPEFTRTDLRFRW